MEDASPRLMGARTPGYLLPSGAAASCRLVSGMISALVIDSSQLPSRRPVSNASWMFVLFIGLRPHVPTASFIIAIMDRPRVFTHLDFDHF